MSGGAGSGGRGGPSEAPPAAGSETALDAGDVSPSGPPLRLLIGVSEPYCQKTACACVHNVTTREYESLRKALKEKFSIELELQYYPSDLFALRKDVREGKLDGVLAKPWPILQAAREGGRDFRRVADLKGPGNVSDLRGILVVKEDSPVRAPADLKGRIVAIGQADSYEKHHATMALFKRHGISPGDGVRIEEFSSCLENIGAVLDGKADAAVVSDYAFGADCLVDVADIKDFRILARTDPAMPAVSLALDTNRVSRADAARLRAALLQISREGSLKESLLGDGFTAPAPWAPAELLELQRR
ncbi:MAG: phosphate/phosphite/phosphonate ABC transporter substrate-binding protein [Planctomycetota bacterium]|nr:phosphate/phosphite/phosphonate ABC transporter substrate-binding protein [Planctomycetota bacterium]